MTRHKAAWWAERVADLARGGDSRAISRRYGVKEQTLIWWRSELRKRGVAGVTRLLPVTIAPVAPGIARDIEVVVELGATRVCVRGAIGVEHLAALVTAARAC